MDKLAIIFSMKSCGHCKTLKEMLDKEDIPYIDRDIDEHSDEYDMFVSITKNEYVPAFMLIESPGQENSKTELYAPERDYNELTEALDIIKEHRKKNGVI